MEYDFFYFFKEEEEAIDVVVSGLVVASIEDCLCVPLNIEEKAKKKRPAYRHEKRT